MWDGLGEMAHFTQEKIVILFRQEGAEPGLEPLSYRSDIDRGGIKVWGSWLRVSSHKKRESPKKVLLKGPSPF